MKYAQFGSPLACLFIASLYPSVAASQDKPSLAKQAQEILKLNCHRCHGQDGTVEGGINYVVDLKSLVTRKTVVPGDPAKSKLLQRVLSGEMPPEGEKPRPSPQTS